MRYEFCIIKKKNRPLEYHIFENKKKIRIKILNYDCLKSQSHDWIICLNNVGKNIKNWTTG